MREVKWAFSFIKGKNVILLIVTWLSGLVFTGLLTIEPMIISHIVDDILKPMFADASVKTEEVIAEVVPLLVLALGIIIARAAIKFWANVQRDEVAYRAIVILRKDIYEKVGAQSRNFFMKNRYNRASKSPLICTLLHFITSACSLISLR